MKKILLSLFSVFTLNSFSQVASYSYTQTAGTYVPIVGGTVVVASGTTPASDDVVYPGQNIGFTFNYNGINYTSFGISSNGFIWFGTGSPNANLYAPISSAAPGTGTIDGMISASGRNVLKRTAVPTGELRVETIGTAPNRVCIIQYSNWRGFGLGTGAQYNFQIGLQETTNTVYLNYGTYSVATAATGTDFQIGLRGLSNVDFKNVVATTANWTGATLGLTNAASSTVSSTIFPASGTIFSFSPPPPCSGTPFAGVASSSVPNACTGTNFTLTLTGTSAGFGITYQWYSSPDNITFTPMAGDTTMTISVSQTDTMYYGCIVTCNNSGMSDTSNVIQVNMNSFINCYCTPPYTVGTGSGDYITLVQLDTINNPTGASASPYYTLYTSPSTSLWQGGTFNLTVSAGTYTSNDLAAWIDFNQNGMFDTIEKIGEAYGTPAGPASTVFSFVVPMSALTGQTHMRVREVYQGTPAPIDPCNAYAYGETEDYLITITSAPPCSTPPVAGTVTGTVSDTIYNTGQYIVSGSIGNIQWYSATNSAGPFTAIPLANNDTLNFVYNTAGNLYFSVIVTNPGCINDTANVQYTNVILPGDSVCQAINLAFGINGPYNNSGTTAEAGEPMPPLTGCMIQSGWCNDANTANNTLWFTFTAPSSGRVILQVPNFDSRIAVWSAAACSDITSGSAVLIAANDDDPNYLANGGAQYSSYVDSIYCLIPGTQYFVQVDGYDNTVDTFNVVLTDPGFPNASFMQSMNSICYTGGETDTLTATVAGGVFSGTGISGNVFYADSSGLGAYTITYTLFGCYDSAATVSVNALPLVNLGVDTVACVSYTLDAGNPGSSYLWSDSSSSQTLVVTTMGIASYTVQVLDVNGCMNSDTVVVTIDPCLGLTEITSANFTMYPNPTNDLVSVVSNGKSSAVFINSAGKIVLTASFLQKTTIDCSSLANGLYTVILYNETGVGTKRLILEK